jgi:hypothetical protein
MVVLLSEVRKGKIFNRRGGMRMPIRWLAKIQGEH